MSVFNDFQRLWMQRFPQSSLSDAWEQDVRASLERHKLKITELTKELEQETLYVEYLERLLSDVDKFRESGGDPAAIFEAAASTGSNACPTLQAATTESNGATEAVAADNSDRLNTAVKSSLNLRDTSSSNSSSNNNNNKDKNNRLSLNTDNKYTTHSSAGNGASGAGGTIVKRATNVDEQNYEREDKDSGNEKDVCSEKNGPLQQCITELAESISNNAAAAAAAAAATTEISSTAIVNTDRDQRRPLQPLNSLTAAERSSMKEVQQQHTSTASDGQRDKLRKTNSHFVTVIEVKESKADKDGDDTGNDAAATTTTFSSFERKTSKFEPTAPPLSPALTSPSVSASSYAAAHSEAIKKMPPRPPPKNIRRVEPPTIPGQLSSSPKRETPFVGSAMPLPGSSESPGNSLERNVKPSDILRQKSSENLDSKSYASNRKTTPELSKFGNAPELMEELGRKVGSKPDTLEKAKQRTELNAASSSSSLGRTSSTPNRTITPGRSSVTSTVGSSPTGSLTKATKLNAADSSSTGSLDKKSRNFLQASDAENANANQRNAGSKESLASQGIPEVIKSYESVSSLSSDSAKAAQHADNEPYYDTVPLDNGEGEYVYIKPGRTGSSSSRDDISTPGSILAMCSTAHLSSQASVTDPESPGRTSNYANIDYFLQQSNETRSSSLDSDGEYESPPIMRAISHDDHTSQTPGLSRKVHGNARGIKIRSILSSIIQSEAIYVECLNKMMQYKKAIHATIKTSQPVLKAEEANTIFFKIDELYKTHTEFLSDLRAIVAHEGGDVRIGETFKRVADMFDLYSAFLHNYNKAIETVKKCSANNPQFKEIVATIVVNLHTEQSLTLEDLLHKPVARVQINALVFSDLLRETPPNHPDYQPLRQAQNIIQMFLKQFNDVDERLTGDSSKILRRSIRNSFIVELVDGHRKLRHLFLFNDVIACAKYKALGRDRLEHELKWFIPLKDVHVFEGVDANVDLRESSPANISQVKKNLRSVRDQVTLEEKDEKARKANGVRASEKYRRKLADLESQLVLASPNLIFRIRNNTNNKVYTFFLSSDFERSQWIDSIKLQQQNCNVPGVNTINPLEVNAFILAISKGMKTEMGSYLMRNTNEESLLVGDLHITVQGLVGLDQQANFFICIEVDSYGHYFRRAKTSVTRGQWNESFVIELEGTQNVRILLYEAQERPLLRAKHVLKLSRSWLTDATQTCTLKLNDTLELFTKLRFVPGELCRATSKPGPLFGAKMSQVLKREKRDIPFIVGACIREVERRGMQEVGIYRVSGSASDLAKLKKSFESDAYEAEQLLKEVDIHSVTGILKSYLRELPEALFSDLLYPKFFETFNAFSNNNDTARINELLKIFEELPAANKACINHILDHLIRVHEIEADNKMSLHNLAMVFGPTLLRPGQTQVKQKDPLAASTVDVMAQAGILYCFLQARIKKD